MIEKNVKPYKQRGDTCAIACMMMVLEYYQKIPKANWHDERRYYNIYGSKVINGTPFSALAYHFAKNDLETTIYHSDINIFNNSKKSLNEQDFEMAMEEYKTFLERASEKGAKVVNGININCDLLKQCLERGNLVILAGEYNNIFHAILLCGYNEDSFIVCDPLFNNKQKRTYDEISSFIDTNIGKWFIEIGSRSKI